MLKKKIIFSLIGFTLGNGPVLTAYAGAAPSNKPDAGQTVQENKPAPSLPSAGPVLNIEVPALIDELPGGETVSVDSVNFTGNTVFAPDDLLAVIGDFSGKRYDLAGLKALANKVSHYYRQKNYPFAKAMIPQQSFVGQVLRIHVVEGAYGEVTTSGDAQFIERAKRFLKDLVSGEVIKGSMLERSVLILSDQPGFKVTPILRPGQHLGTGDLEVNLARTERFGGSVSYDNYGNRFTGRNRSALEVFSNSALTFGDQLKFNALYTQEDLWLGSLAYSMPLGESGLRANLGYSHTYYQLGKDFSELDANGTARIARAGLTYPIIRSQIANLSLVGSLQHKLLNDKNDSVDLSNNKSSDSLPLGLNFDLRDQLLGGGVTYGSVIYTHGKLHLEQSLRDVDRVTAKSSGGFDKLNIDVARIQALPKQLSVFMRVSGQLAADNLDSSEKFGLGGVYGVRAFPSGEGFGDQGALMQAELRLALDAFTPFVFYDAGSVKINHNKFDDGKNTRSVSGAGIGLRYDQSQWAADATLAWRISGGDPVSDSKDYQPMAWASMRYKF